MTDLTLVFDLDGTLVDTAPDLGHATNHVLMEIGCHPVPVSRLRPWVSFGARRMIQEGLAIEGRRLPEVQIDGLLERFLTYYAANIAHESRPYTGAVEALRRWRREGARLAVCTNKREGLSIDLLRKLEMHHYFDAIAGRDTFAASKPDPRHLLGTIGLAGGQATRALMIGDSETDIHAARAARIPIVAVTFGYTHIPVSKLGPDAIIDDFAALDAAVEQLLGRSPT